MKTKEAIQGLAFVAVIGGGAYLYFKAKKLATETLNPTNPNNIVNTTVVDTFGQENVTGVFDTIFAAVDIVNPFNKSDAYAKEVLGMANLNKSDQGVNNG